MTGSWSGVIRVEQSCRRLERLRRTVEEWVRRRLTEDAGVRQYDSQLRTLGTQLGGSLADLRAVLNTIPGSEPTASVHAACRANDHRVELVRRVFEYYRDKFDQRDDPTLAGTLKAADEVVWSCWAEPFRSEERTPPPAPLPYFAPGYAAVAGLRDDPPVGLVADADGAVVAAYRSSLPVPVLALPVLCADDPWSLVWVGHEVGHHLQHEVADQLRLVRAFRDGVEAAARAAGAADSTRWGSWSHELFADVCSVLCMGAAAVDAVVQIELDDEARMMLDTRRGYPPPVARIAFVAEVARLLGLPASDTPAAPVDAAGLLAVARQVADAAVADPLDALGPLTRWYRWDPATFAGHGPVRTFHDGLLRRGPLIPRQRLHTARLLTAAAASAWAEIAETRDPRRREEQRVVLAERYVEAVVGSREQGTRAAAAPTGADPGRLRGQLTALLMRAEVDGVAP